MRFTAQRLEALTEEAGRSRSSGQLYPTGLQAALLRTT